MDKVYFVTNRNLISETAAPWFGIEPSKSLSDLRIGYATLDLKDDRTDPVIGEVFVSPEDKQTSADTASGVRVVPKFSLFGELQNNMRGDVPDTILFIHGFDYKFDEALIGLGRLRQRLNIGKFGPANMVVFTWPSDGQMIPELSYASDRRDAKDSGEAGGRALLQLADFIDKLTSTQLCRGRIHIVAHSMGNYVLRNAIQALVKQLPATPPTLFEQVLLIAADEDYDALELDYKLAPLSHLCKRVTLYYNPGDLALDISRFTKGNPRRLGSRGPRNSSAIADSVILVDASSIAHAGLSDLSYHHYYLISEEMAPDMAQSLKGVVEDKIAGRTALPGRSGSFRLKAAKKT
jgi:esterase/lipase superfamily enzyme